VTISREAVQLASPPSGQVARDAELMADHAGRMLRKAVEAFVESDAELARETRTLESQADRNFDRVFSDLVEEGEAGRRPLQELFAELTVFNALERVTDQAKNLCEETLFSVTGETKAPKTYHVLFVDEANDGPSQLAEAFARKAYPNSGRYASGGWAPADALDPACLQFLETNGYELSEALPKHMPTRREELTPLHVIVSLGGDVRSRLDELPFRTVVLEWELEGQGLEDVYKELALRIRELMETLRGADAD
jgi:protein-tyrosine-phosphatase